MERREGGRLKEGGEADVNGALAAPLYLFPLGDEKRSVGGVVVRVTPEGAAVPVLWIRVPHLSVHCIVCTVCLSISPFVS